MPYRFQSGNNPSEEIRRIAEEQVDRAIGEIESPSLDRHAVVHQVRKRCKKLRAILRLLRGPLDEDDTFDRENARYRDAARRLSPIRDAEALIETYDRLMDHFSEETERQAFGPIRRQLTLRRQEIAGDDTKLDRQLRSFRKAVEEGRRQIAQWADRARDFSDLAPGLKKSYRRGIKAMKAAFAEPSSGRFHEWRKRTKYHWYHCRLLQEMWPPVMKARRDEADRLADLLGNAHDLSVFQKTLAGEADSFGNLETTEAILGLAYQRRESLRGEAKPLGERLFAEKPGHLGGSWGTYWETWPESSGS